MKSKLKILSINLWGVPYPFSRNLKDRIKSTINFIKKENYDIIFIQECWFKTQIRKLKQGLPNYYFTSSEKGLVMNKSGLLILTKQKPTKKYFFKFKNHLFFTRPDEFFALKGVLVTEINVGKNKINFLNTHLFSRSDEKHNPVSKEQLKTLNEVIDMFSSVVTVGDLNINKHEFRKWVNPSYKYFESKIPGLNKKNPYRKYTPVHFNKDGDTVSHVFVKTNPIKTKIKTKVLDDVFLSDHQPLESIIEFT